MVSSIVLCKYFFGLVVIAFTVVGLIEFYYLIEKDNIKPQKILGTAVGIVLTVLNLCVAFTILDFKYLILILPLTTLIFIFELFRKKENSLMNVAVTLLGITYIALPFSMLLYFPLTKTHNELLLSFFIFLWTSDTMAYVVGSMFGKHPLFKRISPKKTIEGTIGGIIFTVIAAIILSKFYIDYSLSQWLIFSGVVAVTGILGDLVESAFKRSIDQKDSGTLFPGHGGLLDRFDSVLIAAPFALIYIKFFI